MPSAHPRARSNRGRFCKASRTTFAGRRRRFSSTRTTRGRRARRPSVASGRTRSTSPTYCSTRSTRASPARRTACFSSERARRAPERVTARRRRSREIKTRTLDRGGRCGSSKCLRGTTLRHLGSGGSMAQLFAGNCSPLDLALKNLRTPLSVAAQFTFRKKPNLQYTHAGNIYRNYSHTDITHIRLGGVRVTARVITLSDLISERCTRRLCVYTST